MNKGPDEDSEVGEEDSGEVSEDVHETPGEDDSSTRRDVASRRGVAV
ncbi:hypothetical protein ACFVVP_10570 [Streptomyces sp. NPDC058128]|nr:hypothetical protein [Streptomyces sp. CB02009]